MMDIVGLVLGLAVFAGIIVLVDMAYKRGFDDGLRAHEDIEREGASD
jgi:hypothetical protein